MEFREQLRKRLGRENSDRILEQVLQRPDLVAPLLDAYLGKDPTVVNLAAMTFGNLARHRPDWCQPYQLRVLRASQNPLHPGVRRNAMRYFSEVPVLVDDDLRLPAGSKRNDFLYLRRSKLDPAKHAWIAEEIEGELLDHCLLIVDDVNEPAAPRVFGMLTAQHLCLKYPEISVELAASIESTMEYGTAGFKNRGRKCLALLHHLIELYGLG